MQVTYIGLNFVIFDENIWLYVGNDTKQGHRYYVTIIGNMCSIEPWHFRRPWLKFEGHFRVFKKFLPAGLRETQPCRYCFYSVVQKCVFRPAGATRCPQVRSPMPNFTFMGAKNVRTQPPKLSKFWILTINFPLRGNSFAVFFTKFSDFIRVYR